MKLYLVTGLILALCHLSTTLEDKVVVLQSPHDRDEMKMIVTYAEDTEDAEGVVYGCEIFTDKQLIEEVVTSSKTVVFRQPTEEEMADILQECTTFSLRRLEDSDKDAEDEAMDAPRRKGTTPAEVTTEGYSGWNIIFPGTKWCGPGNIAKDYEDLGLHQDTDRCCRAHDLCDDLMAPGETKNNLTNTSPFTKLSCDCDEEFYDCLSRVDTVISNTIGNKYFNLAKRSCYKKVHPLTKKCKKYRTFLKLTCAEYERDKKAPMVYEWVDARIYKKLPFPGPLTITLPF